MVRRQAARYFFSQWNTAWHSKPEACVCQVLLYKGDPNLNKINCLNKSWWKNSPNSGLHSRCFTVLCFRTILCLYPWRSQSKSCSFRFSQSFINHDFFPVNFCSVLAFSFWAWKETMGKGLRACFALHLF